MWTPCCLSPRSQPRQDLSKPSFLPGSSNGGKAGSLGPGPFSRTPDSVKPQVGEGVAPGPSSCHWDTAWGPVGQRAGSAFVMGSYFLWRKLWLQNSNNAVYRADQILFLFSQGSWSPSVINYLIIPFPSDLLKGMCSKYGYRYTHR